jgi:hypothetical protein
MTLKVVSDNTVELPVYNFQDIAACARRWAEQVVAGEQGEIVRALVVTETSEGIALSLWGDNANGYELMGILEAAKFRAYDVNVCGDEY